MPRYLLEHYLPGGSLTQANESAHRLAEEATRGGLEFRYVRTLILTEDETCFHIFEAPSREAITEIAHLVGFPDARVTEAIEHTTTGRRRQ